jgi:hypothetical protein
MLLKGIRQCVLDDVADLAIRDCGRKIKNFDIRGFDFKEL